MAVQPWEYAVLPVGVTHAGIDFATDIFGRKKAAATPDITSELARITALFNEQRAAAKAGINQDAADTRTSAASNLAARGVYSSPVSENVFGKIDLNRQNALAQALARISGDEAGVRANLLSQLLGISNSNRIAADQANAAKMSQLAGLGSSLLLAGLTGPAAPAVKTIAPSIIGNLLPTNTNSLARSLYASDFYPAPSAPAISPVFPSNNSQNLLAQRLYAQAFR